MSQYLIIILETIFPLKGCCSTSLLCCLEFPSLIYLIYWWLPCTYILKIALSFNLCSWCMWTFMCRTVMFWINFSFYWFWFDLVELQNFQSFLISASILLSTPEVFLYICLFQSEIISAEGCLHCLLYFLLFFFFFSLIALLFLFHTLLLSFPLCYLFFILLLLSFTYSIPFYPSALVPYPFP